MGPKQERNRVLRATDTPHHAYTSHVREVAKARGENIRNYSRGVGFPAGKKLLEEHRGQASGDTTNIRATNVAAHLDLWRCTNIGAQNATASVSGRLAKAGDKRAVQALAC